MSIGSFLFHRAEDAVLPGSGEVTSVLEKLRPLLPYILGLIAVLIVAFVIWRAPWAESRQKTADYAHFQPKLDKALLNIRTLQSNERILSGALDTQNRAVTALKADGDKRTADGRKALSDAQRANAGLSAQADALRKSAGRKVDNTPCPISDTLAKAGAI